MLRPVLRIFQILYCIYAYLVFISLLLVIFPFVLVSLLAGQPSSGNFALTLCRIWADVWLLLIGIRHRNIAQEPIEKTGQYVFVANHISYLDVPVIFKVLRNQHFRVLGKAELGRVPLFGAVYKLAVVLVDRSSAEKRARSVANLKKIIGRNISIFIFPEGTFNITEQPLKSFYDGAFRVALETGTAIKPIVFPDTLHRLHFHSVFSLTPGLNRAVILPAVPVAHLSMDDLPVLKKQVYEMMEKVIIEYRQKDGAGT